MGYIAHHALIMTAYDWTGTTILPEHRDEEGRDIFQVAIEEFRSRLPEADGCGAEHWRDLLVGPIKAIANGDISYCWLPDGSKEGWDISDQGDEYRRELIELCHKHEVDFVEVRFGGDERHDPSIERYGS